MNTLRTFILMAFMAALMVAIGGLIGGKTGLMIGLIIAVVTNFISYWFSDSIVIAADGAQPVSEEEAPDLYQIVRELCTEANLPMPRVYVSPNEQPNAFATGRDPEHAVVAVTVGILRLLNKREMKAVLAHEIGHVRNRDILICTIGAVMAAAITWIAHLGYYRISYSGRDDEESSVNPIFAIAMMILAPFAATLIRLAISRSREFEADATGAHMCHDPEALASALAKISEGVQARPRPVNPAFSSLYIMEPGGLYGMVSKMMSTHPPIEERIKRLEEMDMTGRSR